MRLKKLIFLICFISCNSILFCITEKDILSHFNIDFHESMRFNPHYNKQLVLNDLAWQHIVSLYEKIKTNRFNCYEIVRIPKIIHQIWLGSPLPATYQAFIKTWQHNHPTWEYKLWTDADIGALGLENKAMYDATTNYGEKSDIARYEILYRFGGLYVDIDFECLKPFDILHLCFDFYVGLTYAKKANILIGLIGSVPEHPILKECITTMRRDKNAKDTFDQILKRTGPAFFTDCFMKKAYTYDGPVIALPSTYFYPWPWQYRDEKNSEKIRAWIQPESFAIHHWHVSWNDGKAK